MEHLGTKEVVGVWSWFEGPARKPRVALVGKIESFFISGAKGPTNLLSLLKAWKIGQKKPDGTIKARSLLGHLYLFWINIIIVLKDNYLNKLTDLFGLELLKWKKR